MNNPNIYLQDNVFVLQDVSIENPRPLLISPFASALGMLAFFKHTRAILSPIPDYSDYAKTLIAQKKFTKELALAELNIRNSCASISHQIDFHMTFEKETIFMLSVTACGIVNLDRNFSEMDNRHHAASLLLPGMKEIISNFLQMSGVMMNMEKDQIITQFFEPEYLKSELRKSDQARNSEENIQANRAARLV